MEEDVVFFRLTIKGNLSLEMFFSRLKQMEGFCLPPLLPGGGLVAAPLERLRVCGADEGKLRLAAKLGEEEKATRSWARLPCVLAEAPLFLSGWCFSTVSSQSFSFVGGAEGHTPQGGNPKKDLGCCKGGKVREGGWR